MRSFTGQNFHEASGNRNVAISFASFLFVETQRSNERGAVKYRVTLPEGGRWVVVVTVICGEVSGGGRGGVNTI